LKAKHRKELLEAKRRPKEEQEDESFPFNSIAPFAAMTLGPAILASPTPSSAAEHLQVNGLGMRFVPVAGTKVLFSQPKTASV
jgi:hypothetical protein